MTLPPRPKDPAERAMPDFSGVDVEPLPGSGLPAGLTAEAQEELTPEDLAARAGIGFALDLEPFLPGPAVGSERVLLETDPDGARRLGVRPDGDVSPPPQALPWAPPEATPPAEAAPPAPPPLLVDSPHVDVEPVLDSPASPVEELAPAWTPPAPPVWTPPPPPAVAPPLGAATPVPFISQPSPVMEPPRARVGISSPQGQSGTTRSYPVAFAWAGLGTSPTFGQNKPARPTRQQAEAPTKAPMEELLDLAAVGKGADGVTEMLLIFKEDVLRGLTCKLRLEPKGMLAHFVAPDETVRRYVESTAEDLLTRMRRRGLKVAGWTVDVG